MDGFQSAEDWQLILIIEPPIHCERFKSEEGSATRLQPAAGARDPFVLVAAGAMLSVESRRRHPGAMLPREARHVVGMIEMSVRQQNSTDRQCLPSTPAQSPPQRRPAADESRVDQVEAIRVAQDVEADKRGANLQYVVWNQGIR